MRASNPALDELVIGEIAATIPQVREPEELPTIEIADDDLADLCTLKFERPPWHNDDVGTETIRGNGFPLLAFQKPAIGTFTGMWYRSSEAEDKLATIEDIAARPFPIPLWLIAILTFGGLAAGAAAWFI